MGEPPEGLLPVQEQDVKVTSSPKRFKPPSSSSSSSSSSTASFGRYDKGVGAATSVQNKISKNQGRDIAALAVEADNELGVDAFNYDPGGARMAPVGARIRRMVRAARRAATTKQRKRTIWQKVVGAYSKGYYEALLRKRPTADGQTKQALARAAMTVGLARAKRTYAPLKRQRARRDKSRNVENLMADAAGVVQSI